VAVTETAAPGVLDRIVEEKRREVEALRPRAGALRALADDAPPTRGFAAALRRPGVVRLLAEVKRRSPSAGEIRPGAAPGEIARAYEAGGAAAVSVLTDRTFFGGAPDDLPRARDATALPVLRKDFTIDPLQVREARALGADAVLLIVRILEDAALVDLLGLATELGMDALVEVHHAGELERALRAGATLVGMNNRDLQSFTTDLSLSLRLARAVPPEVTFVAESGIRSGADVERLGAAGVDAVLVGEHLMRRPDVAQAARALVGHPKGPRA
jgi:indole-3-glycerol phosphate synthase